MLRGLAFLILFSGGKPGMAVDIQTMWDFSRPELSEQRFRDALASASGDDALILTTQIARSYGLRGRFEEARALLASVQAALPSAGAEAQVRHALELGRSWVSAAHPAAALTPEARQQAREAWGRALEIARAAQLDALAIDVLHMMAFVDDAPADQLRWGRAALALAQSSSQPQARDWQASLENNIGCAQHALGQFDEALASFERALALREAQGDAGRIRIARWMVAWTLRAQGRNDEALAIQQRLDREGEAAGEPDRYVHEELELLYRARGDEARAAQHAARARALAGS